MCGLRTRPQMDIDPTWVELPSVGAYHLAALKAITCEHQVPVIHCHNVLDHPAKAGRLIFCLFLLLTISVRHYLKIYETNLHQICRVGRTMAVDDQSEISFWYLKGCHGIAMASNLLLAYPQKWVPHNPQNWVSEFRWHLLDGGSIWEK